MLDMVTIINVRILSIHKFLLEFVYLYWPIRDSPFCNLANCSTKRKELLFEYTSSSRVAFWSWHPTTGLTRKENLGELALQNRTSKIAELGVKIIEDKNISR